MYSYAVTIGRNVGTEPLPARAWADFQDVVYNYLIYTLAWKHGTVEIHAGAGEWDGVPEDSAKITLLREEPITDRQLSALRVFLKIQARRFSQDAIALTIGQSELVYA